MLKETGTPPVTGGTESGLAIALGQHADASETAARRSRRLAILTILLVGAFYLATIRQGHPWGDDFGMYISHARNIAEGTSYSQTGYIYNPDAIIGPKTYPPVCPALLAPVYKLWGLNLAAMKVEIILVFLGVQGSHHLGYALPVVCLSGFVSYPQSIPDESQGQSRRRTANNLWVVDRRLDLSGLRHEEPGAGVDCLPARLRSCSE
ncbi:MAG: hypothetical protein ACREEM_30505 [Blastocatellia bacterium]